MNREDKIEKVQARLARLSVSKPIAHPKFGPDRSFSKRMATYEQAVRDAQEELDKLQRGEDADE